MYTLKQNQIDWDNYFLEMLELVKKRSPDKETKVACILTENNRIISTGYNGWPSGINNLPDTRPYKYPYMIHSEINAITNLLIKPTSPTVYITHLPCNICLKALWQIGCRRIVLTENRKFFSFSDDDKRVLDCLISYGLIIDCKDFKPNKNYKFVRVGQGISKVNLEHFGDFE